MHVPHGQDDPASERSRAPKWRSLLADGKTDLIPGFVSARTGRTFKAFLVLKEDGKVGFEFAPRAEKPAKGAKATAKKETKEAESES